MLDVKDQKIDCNIQFYLHYDGIWDVEGNIPCLTKEAMTKYRRVMQFAMGWHIIHIHVRWDMDHQWLTMTYKLVDEELDAIIDDWTVSWKVLFHIDELSDTKGGSPPIILVEKDK